MRLRRGFAEPFIPENPARGNAVMPRRRLGCIGLCAMIALATAGCSLSIPLGSLMPSNDYTGSIRAEPPPLPVGEEDRRFAEAALTVAFDPAETGQMIEWANPKTGAKGAFSRVGPMVSRGKDNKQAENCGAFVAVLAGSVSDRWFQGLACAAKPGDWRVIEAKPWVKPV